MKGSSWVLAIASLVQSLAAIIGVVYVVEQLDFAKNEFLDYKNQRVVEKMEDLVASFNTSRMLYLRSEMAKNYPQDGASYPDATEPHTIATLNFFEGLAEAQQRGVVTTEDLWFYFSDPISCYWYGWKKWVEQYRTENGDPEYYGGFERIAETLKTQKNTTCDQAMFYRVRNREQERYEIDNKTQPPMLVSASR